MIALGTDPGPILVPFWNPKSDRIGPKRVEKSIKKVIEKHVEFGIDFWSILIDFWSILGRFWNDFGSILGSMLVDFCLVAGG